MVYFSHSNSNDIDIAFRHFPKQQVCGGKGHVDISRMRDRTRRIERIVPFSRRNTTKRWPKWKQWNRPRKVHPAKARATTENGVRERKRKQNQIPVSSTPNRHRFRTRAIRRRLRRRRDGGRSRFERPGRYSRRRRAIRRRHIRSRNRTIK